MSRIEPGLYDFVTDDYLRGAPVAELNAGLAKLKALTGPQLAADNKAKRAVRDGIDRIYRELDARAKGGTSVGPASETPAAPPAPAKTAPAKAEKPAPAKAAKPAKAAEPAPAAQPAQAAKPVAAPEPARPAASPVPPPTPRPPPPVAAASTAEGDEEFEEEDDSETFGEAGDFD